MVDQNENLLPGEQDTVMIYFNPELIQTLADRSAEKRQNFRELLSAAEDGDLDAAYRLAQNYRAGEDGAPEDPEQAFRWFARAAEGDHVAAQFALGQCYARGFGTEKDVDKALELFTAGAELGYLPAVCELGLCYELGQGVEQNKALAVELYRQAAEQVGGAACWERV